MTATFSNLYNDYPILQVIKAPGHGLLSFTTGSGAARDMLSPHFGNDAYELGAWSNLLKERLQNILKSIDTSIPVIIGIPSDCGGGICRGAAHGPLHLRHTLYQQHPSLAQQDLGDIPCIPHLLDDQMLNQKQLELSGKALWGDAYQSGAPVAPLNLLEAVLVALWQINSELRPLVLGGDHSVSGPVFNAMQQANKLKNLAVLHFDAHTDLLEDRYGVENCFATWTAHAVRKLEEPQTWVQLGIRASGKDQAHWEKEFGLKQYWAKACRELNPEALAEELVQNWKALGCTHLYITNDIDGTDASFAPSTGTPEYEGLDAEWVRVVIKKVTEQLPLVGSDLTEVAPVLGAPEAVQKTLDTGVSFLNALQWR